MIDEEEGMTGAEMLRRKAEEKLNTRQDKSPDLHIEADVKKLLHELQVHQIELEMQNEELRLANETAETALKKYTMLYDLAPIGYFILDQDGSIADLNFTGADMLREKRYQLLGSNFKLYISEESRQIFNEFFISLYSGYSKESCNVMLGYDNKSLCFVYMEGIVTDDDRKCLLSLVDTTEFRNAVTH
ncbi:MAG: PAS/PAC sensor signal transduction histidine kinase [Bacteroidetes bacterium]|nr:MAG: PAS/PAC sensor signal transduction histidine kinase [Bacteroidota bacterium]